MTSAAFAKQLQQVTDKAGIIALLEITCPDFSGPLQIANDTRAWTSNGVQYMGYPFSFQLPTDSVGETARMQLAISNVGRGLSEELERLGPNTLVMGSLLLASRNNPNQIEMRYPLPMTSVSVTPVRASANCGMDALMRQQAMKRRMTAEAAPGIHA